MLDSKVIKIIENFVYSCPRSIQEIASHVNKNWRTVDRYVKQIEEDFGTIATKTFRGGTRGALKVVYWAAVEKVSNSVFQEEIEKEIEKGRTKNDFSSFDIFQHVPTKNRHAWIKKGENESKAGRLKEFKNLLMKAEKEILFFSGNLSFVNFKDKETNVFDVLEELVKKNIRIKVLCRVDLPGIKNIEKLLSLNFKYKKELIEIRHRRQPLRVTIIDDKLVNLKEVKEPTMRDKETKEKIFIFYTVKDKEWAEWLAKIFRRMFNKSVLAEKRLDLLKTIPSK